MEKLDSSKYFYYYRRNGKLFDYSYDFSVWPSLKGLFETCGFELNENDIGLKLHKSDWVWKNNELMLSPDVQWVWGDDYSIHRIKRDYFNRRR